jgi:hypothetical protein
MSYGLPRWLHRHRHGNRRWGARSVVLYRRRNGQIVPLWAESGKWGPQRHPAAPGKPWSVRRRRRVSGCRISNLCVFRHSLAAAASCMPPASPPLCKSPRRCARKSACICLQLRVRGTTFFDTSPGTFLLHSLSLVAGVSAITCGLPIIAAHVLCFIRPIRSQCSTRERNVLAPVTHLAKDSE